MGKFDDILKRAAGFVDRNKGRWDNAEWLGFLADVRQRGTDLSREAEDYLGQVLESMKCFYRENGQTQGKGISESLSGVSQQAAKFVHQSRGMWDHSAWEKFLKDVQKAGVKVSGETTAYVGEILEASKRVYEALPGVDGGGAAAPKAAAPKAAAPKAAAPKAAAPKAAAPKQKSSGSNGAQRAKGGLAKTSTKSGAKSSAKKSSSAARVVTAPAKRSNGKPTASRSSSAAKPSASKKGKRKSR